MVTTRSMSTNMTKSVTTKKGTKNAAVKKKPPPKFIEKNQTRMDALSIFMIKQYLPQYYEANPPFPTIGLIPDEVINSGHEEWFYMSESEKAPWIDISKNMKAEGQNLYTIQKSMAKSMAN